MNSNIKRVSIPFWKKILSWVYPFNIETTKSSVSNSLEVNLQYGILVIDTKEANYSYGNLHFVFQEAISSLSLSHQKKYKVLILGFGAGSIANILINEQYLNCTITGIELDEKIIELSKKYYNPNIFSNSEIIIQDAFEFIKTNKESYDLVFVDIFIDTNIPKDFQSIIFLEKVKKALNDNGQVLMNSMSNTDDLINNWETTFDELEAITVQDNNVLHYLNKAL